ncbi:non-canonical purine NTP pyrophosphatase [archaeon CG10_big_fil_rev_8_21_14_0_10_43_11]|nr:MAG: non-canonical purine NTP pyrophosphatase [archaeon CG10_big_fil_rev_8_21_14_0_10_43_11]
MGGIVLLTGNLNKVREAESILGRTLEHYALDLEEIQSVTPQDVVAHKINQAYAILKKPVFVWDVSLEFEALNGFPGPLIKFFYETVGLETICSIINNLKNTDVTARTTLGYHDGRDVHYFEGVARGRVPKKPQGTHWAWDPIFIPHGKTRTFAQMSLAEKNEYSMHKKALEAFRTYLETRA